MSSVSIAPVHVGDLHLGKEERKAILEILNSGRISEGPFVRKFERSFASYVGTNECVALNSGTSALITGLTVLKAGSFIHGRTVITSPLTYIATANAIVLTGFEPLFVDVDPETFVITPDNVRACIEGAGNDAGLAAILPVHLMGYPCDMDAMNAIARDHGLVTFEDSAQAHGSLYKGRRTGSLSLLSDFSFYIAHNIQAGELGALVTDDPSIARLARKVKANGRMCDCPVCIRTTGVCPHRSKEEGRDIDPRFTHDLIGYNFKAMEFQAAIALYQLKRADKILRRRQENVRYLNDALASLDKVLALPPFSREVSYLSYPLVIKDPQQFPRERVRDKLEAARVETRPLFGCIPTQQPSFQQYRQQYAGRLPVAERLGRDGFYIGCHQYLTEEQLEHVVETLKGIFSSVVGLGNR